MCPDQNERIIAQCAWISPLADSTNASKHSSTLSCSTPIGDIVSTENFDTKIKLLVAITLKLEGGVNEICNQLDGVYVATTKTNDSDCIFNFLFYQLKKFYTYKWKATNVLLND